MLPSDFILEATDKGEEIVRTAPGYRAVLEFLWNVAKVQEGTQVSEAIARRGNCGHNLPTIAALHLGGRKPRGSDTSMVTHANRA